MSVKRVVERLNEIPTDGLGVASWALIALFFVDQRFESKNTEATGNPLYATTQFQQTVEAPWPIGVAWGWGWR